MLTTNDNPYDPFEDYDNWLSFDIEKGYYSCSKLDRIAKMQDDFTEVEFNAERERAIDAIVQYDIMDKFIKATKVYPDFEDSSSTDEVIDDETKDETKINLN